MARFRPDAFPGGNLWQVFRFMHPKSGLGQEKAPLPGNISPPCIQNELVLARYARHVSEKPRKPLLEDASREYLARKGPFSLPRSLESCTARESCQGAPTARTPRIMHTAQILPSVAAEQRERSQARRRPYGVAACLGTAERGAGGFLSGGVALPKECVALWGVERWRQSRHSRSAACGSLTPIDSPNLENRHSRGGLRVGRRQGGAYQAAPPSEGCSLPVERLFRLRTSYAANF